MLRHAVIMAATHLRSTNKKPAALNGTAGLQSNLTWFHPISDARRASLGCPVTGAKRDELIADRRSLSGSRVVSQRLPDGSGLQPVARALWSRLACDVSRSTPLDGFGGRCWIRTSDLYDVNVAL